MSSDITARAREALDGDGTWKPVGPWSNLVSDLLAEVQRLDARLEEETASKTLYRAAAQSLMDGRRRVEALHRETSVRDWKYCEECADTHVDFPCPTLKAVWGHDE